MLTVEENVVLPLRLAGLDTDPAWLGTVLRTVELDGCADKQPVTSRAGSSFGSRSRERSRPATRPMPGSPTASRAMRRASRTFGLPNANARSADVGLSELQTPAARMGQWAGRAKLREP